MTQRRHLSKVLAHDGRVNLLEFALEPGPAFPEPPLCAQADPEIWFPSHRATPNSIDRNNINAAKAICAKCPLATACLEWAIEHNEEHGIWGGLTYYERKRLKLNGGRRRKPEYCKNGHKFTPENTYVRPNGGRTCKECQRRQVAAYKRNRGAA